MGWGGCGQALPRLARDACPDSHERAKGATTVRHGSTNALVPDASHHLLALHSNHRAGKDAEERPAHHAQGATHHEAHLHTVKAPRLGPCRDPWLPAPHSRPQ